MIYIKNNRNYIYSKNTLNIEDCVQTIDDNSKLGQKIISMIPYVKLIYEDGLVVGCEEVEHIEQEPTIEEQVTNIQELVVQQQYELELLKLGITE